MKYSYLWRHLVVVAALLVPVLSFADKTPATQTGLMQEALSGPYSSNGLLTDMHKLEIEQVNAGLVTIYGDMKGLIAVSGLLAKIRVQQTVLQEASKNLHPVNKQQQAQLAQIKSRLGLHESYIRFLNNQAMMHASQLYMAFYGVLIAKTPGYDVKLKQIIQRDFAKHPLALKYAQMAYHQALGAAKNQRLRSQQAWAVQRHFDWSQSPVANAQQEMASPNQQSVLSRGESAGR